MTSHFYSIMQNHHFIGRKKQWVMSWKAISYDSMVRTVEKTLGCYPTGQNEDATRSIFEEVAQKLRIDADFVANIAKGSKTSHAKSGKRIKKSRA